VPGGESLKRIQDNEDHNTLKDSGEKLQRYEFLKNKNK
jgi:hypothetical protein